jgi:hypothetical protein
VRASLVTLLPAIALTLLMLSVTCLVGSPLLTLVFLDLGICHGFFLLDGFAQHPMIHALLLQLHLVVVENAIQLRCPLFRELAPFHVELDCRCENACAQHPPNAAHWPVVFPERPVSRASSEFSTGTFP